MLLFKDLANRPIVIIRFNPDKYKTKDNIIRGCFRFDEMNNISCYEGEFKRRFDIVKETIDYHINNVPQKEVTIVKLFYDLE